MQTMSSDQIAWLRNFASCGLIGEAETAHVADDTDLSDPSAGHYASSFMGTSLAERLSLPPAAPDPAVVPKPAPSPVVRPQQTEPAAPTHRTSRSDVGETGLSDDPPSALMEDGPERPRPVTTQERSRPAGPQTPTRRSNDDDPVPETTKPPPADDDDEVTP